MANILLWISIISFSYFFLRNIKRWLLLAIAWMIHHGWYFPKIMREEREKNIKRILAESKQIDKLVADLTKDDEVNNEKRLQRMKRYPNARN
jgi:hypothetical protein